MPFHFRKPWLLLLLIAFPLLVFAQRKKQKASVPATNTAKAPTNAPTSLKPFNEAIGTQAQSARGLFSVHYLEEKWYFELADSLFNRDLLLVSRYSKGPSNANRIGNRQQVIRWEKGPSQKVFLRVVPDREEINDSMATAQAVHTRTLTPIEAVFEVKSLGRYSNQSLVIEVTDFLKGDNSLLLPAVYGSVASDRSYIDTVKTFPINTEVTTVKTFSGTGGAETIEIRNSFLLLSAKPMRTRLPDPRIGYITKQMMVSQTVQTNSEQWDVILRWRLEPQAEDVARWQRGELVEPRNPIVYYIDPATPKKWRPYLMQGVNDWNVAFEQAGFKDAITAREWPESDSTMDLEDARFSVIHYYASDAIGAFGASIYDPRSGEILAGDVSWLHNVMSILHDWYFIQAAAVDPQARKMVFPDSLMGKLIRFVSSHEVGHTLGLLHNMGASHVTPVEKLRDKAWLEKYGHTVSIMDYARFNYVAQPEDSIPQHLLFPRIGLYDKWAIEWGYKPLPDSLREEEQAVLHTWIKFHQTDPLYWYGKQQIMGIGDPRSQAEALGDNNMKASEYGIRNLKRVMAHLPEWTRAEGDPYTNLSKMYEGVVNQYTQYLNHVLANIGGVYETNKTSDQPGDVYEPTPKAIQKEAVRFLQGQFFAAPAWLLDKKVLNKISSPTQKPYESLMDKILAPLLDPSRLKQLLALHRRDARTYSLEEYYADLKKGVWGELNTHSDISSYRRDLQKRYVDGMISLLKGIEYDSSPTAKSDVSSLTKAHLKALRKNILAALPRMKEPMSRYHLEEMAERIERALDLET